MYLADFHIHSNFSDGKLSIPELVDLHGEQGFGAIAITDHLCESRTFLGRAARYLEHTLTPATFPLYSEILKSEAKRAMDQYGMVLLPGFELTKNSIANSRSAHMVGIGVSEYMPADGDAVELIHQIHDQGGLAIAAHPVFTRKIEKQTFHLWSRREELREYFDAWEVASGPYLFPQVVESDLPKVASSDLHVRSQMTSWKTVLECERNPEAVIGAIKRQELKVVFYNEESQHKNKYELRDIINLSDLGSYIRNHPVRDLVDSQAL